MEEFVKEKEDHVKSLVCPNLYAYIKAPSPPHVLLLIIDEWIILEFLKIVCEVFCVI